MRFWVGCGLVVYPGVNGGGEGVGVLPCWCCRGGLAALRVGPGRLTPV